MAFTAALVADCCAVSQILAFLSTVLAVPNSSVVDTPGLAELYVHYHFVKFMRDYHTLALSGSQGKALAASCKAHIQVCY